MKTAIAIVFVLLTVAAASAQGYLQPNPGECLGRRCGYFLPNGGSMTPAPNGGYYINQPTQPNNAGYGNGYGNNAGYGPSPQQPQPGYGVGGYGR